VISVGISDQKRRDDAIAGIKEARVLLGRAESYLSIATSDIKEMNDGTAFNSVADAGRSIEEALELIRRIGRSVG
jgi:hypothetical protein